MNEESIDKFLNEWFSDTETKPQSIQQSKSTNRLTEEEIDRAFEEINKLCEEALENAHKSGRLR